MMELPEFNTDIEAESFVAHADLTDFDLSEMVPVRFQFAAKTERVNMLLPKSVAPR